MDRRPPTSTEELLQKAYDHFFLSHTSFSQLKDAALKGRLHNNPLSSNGVAGRSIAWKLFLAKHEPLQSSSSPRVSNLLEWLRGSRMQYTTLMLEKTRVPDGNYDQTSRISQETTSTENLNLINPLSLYDENPWNEWFASVELRKTILQDVERTFPDIPFFRDPQVQESLTNVLFIYSVMHPDTGYRQGMHELLAPLFYAISFDSIPQEGDTVAASAIVRELCSESWIAADAWTLFEAVMQGVSRWYEWHEPPMHTESSPRTNSQVSGSYHITGGQNGMQPYIAPIVQTCNYIQSTLLKASDPMLWKHIHGAGIEPQIYGIRWLRLLFTREFSMPDAMMLWDGLFATDPTMALSQWVCVAMLIRIRNELIPGDYSAQLTALLHYPPLPESKLDGAPNHACLLLQQALSLQMAPTPSTGASLMMENRTLLNIPLELPTSTFQQSTRRQADKSYPSSSSNVRSGVESDHVPYHTRHTSSPSLGIPEMIARGLIERGESLGINKTLMSAVSEIRRNIPDLSTSLSRPPNQSASFPLEEDRPAERSTWDTRSRFETERGFTQLQARDRRLGESLGWIVDALLQDESEARDVEQLKRQKREALETLSYVRDVLTNNIVSLDPDMLVGEEEALKRRQRRKQDEDLRSQSSESGAVVSVPVPVQVIDSQPKAPNDGRLNTPFRPLSFTSNTQASTIRRPSPLDHTLSSFSNSPVHVFSSSPLPRRPSPTSTSLRRVHIAERSADQAKVSHSTDGYQDPLGALRG